MVGSLLEHVPPVPWIILFSPLVSCALITLFFLKRPKAAAAVSLAGILVSLVFSVWMFQFHLSGSWLPAETTYEWIRVPGFSADFGFLIDRLSLLMLLIVTGVGSCIFLYSIGYMKDDPSTGRYFASLSLFAFSMLGIVLSNNFLMLFVFWELVALSSYLLIGFWFEKPSAADAGNKAFIVNRLADFGLVLGIITLWAYSGAGGGERTFSFTELSRALPALLSQGLLSQPMLTAAALLVFCGAAGKSAQFPLYIWLPDAMEGPTPVSALIHAATMVAAGVFLLCRAFFLVGGSDAALGVIAHFGALTALLAALLAVVQTDIKKILAYSTVSQLGYMVLALGLGSSEAAMFHLTTHAFFKALLFLGAGAMIHSLHTQDIWEMGGLLKRMPVTAVTFLLGTLALCGIWPMSGFFSKDEILAAAFEHNKFLFAVGLFTAALTAFYMTRTVWIAVLGPERAHKHSHNHHVHDAPWVMKFPLVTLAVLSVAGGFIGIAQFIAGPEHHAEALNMTVAAAGTAAALLGIALGTRLYARAKTKQDPLVGALGAFYAFVVSKYYLDELFSRLASVFQTTLAALFLRFDLQVVIRGGVDGTAKLTSGFGSLLRRAQTGSVQAYALLFGFGIVLLVYFAVWRGF